MTLAAVKKSLAKFGQAFDSHVGFFMVPKAMGFRT